MSKSPTQILKFAENLARQAGTLAKEHRANGLTYTMKAAYQMVTEADGAVERLIIDGIRAQFPDHCIWAEETAAEIDPKLAFHEPLWIIDPIDGTTNYSYGQFNVAVSIAFAEEGVVQAGIVHAPFLEETFTAVRGGGARLNGSSIRCSDLDALDHALIICGRPSDEERECFTRQVNRVLEHCFDIRRLGSAALDICWVGCGRAHGFWETLHAWDMAAAALIAKEAGARVGHLADPPSPPPVPLDLYTKGLLVAAPRIFDNLRNLLNDAADC